MTLIVGLTGGIGSGKSEVASRFAKHGVPVVDADVIAAELVKPGTAALQEIIASLGPEFLDATGTLDRPKLRDKVFSDDQTRRKLNNILHPRVRQVIKARISTLKTPYCIVVIPLLVETAQEDLVDRILVTETPLKLRYQRLSERDGASTAEIDRIIATQSAADVRIAAADDILSNDKDLKHLYHQVDELHRHYQQLADPG